MRLKGKEKKTQILIFIAFSLLFVTLLISLLAVTFKELTLIRTNQRDGLLAFSMAQAGLERAKIEFSNNWGWTGRDTNNNNQPDSGEELPLRITLQALAAITDPSLIGYYWVDIVSLTATTRQIQIWGWRGTAQLAQNTTRRVIQCTIERLGAAPGPYTYRIVPGTWSEI